MGNKHERKRQKSISATPISPSLTIDQQCLLIIDQQCLLTIDQQCLLTIDQQLAEQHCLVTIDLISLHCNVQFLI